MTKINCHRCGARLAEGSCLTCVARVKRLIRLEGAEVYVASRMLKAVARIERRGREGAK